MLTGGVAYRQKPSSFHDHARRDKKNRFSSVNFIPDIHFQNLVPDTALLLPDYGINVLPPLSACGIPERLSRSSSLMTIYSRTALRPPSFVLTQNLNQNELQQ